ncbi:hypothetical protein RJ640_013378 [Escallonia rubra]|uniref:non-specific serine/threonine protein kinase n=1 Tax=Escallonia rubra TaxID=112253 RepID=A0AA88RA37_9ASTE|nr:hypothetical protein RJ640_013378 [Escallonia rubra]
MTLVPQNHKSTSDAARKAVGAPKGLDTPLAILLEKEGKLRVLQCENSHGQHNATSCFSDENMIQTGSKNVPDMRLVCSAYGVGKKSSRSKESITKHPTKLREDALEWGIRKKIILNIAKGLAYLHKECKSRIIHLDIKPQNILLDENFNAKLSDFGLAKLMDRNQSQVMTQMRGTRGYLAPEWLSRKITEKADVYSFGVVMLEVVCGRRNLDYSASEEAENLLEILKEKSETNELVDLVDKCNVNMQRHEEEAVELVRTAIWCLYADPARRPSMSTVVKGLEGATTKEHILDFSFFMPTTQAKSREDLVMDSASQEASIFIAGLLAQLPLNHNAVNRQGWVLVYPLRNKPGKEEDRKLAKEYFGTEIRSGLGTAMKAEAHNPLHAEALAGCCL